MEVLYVLRAAEGVCDCYQQQSGNNCLLLLLWGPLLLLSPPVSLCSLALLALLLCVLCCPAQVIQCVLHDFDVVFAPLIASYGSATATLEASPGTTVSMFITYLTPTLQQRMHETEGAYNLVKLEDVQLLEGVSLQQHM